MRYRNTLRAVLATVALATASIAAFPASAAHTTVVTLSNIGDPFGLPAGQQLIANFDDADNPDATLVDGVTITRDGATVGFQEGWSGYSGTLPNDDTHYLTIPGGSTTTFDSLRLLSSFSLFMGSPDTYNWIQFIGEGFNETLSGADMFLGDTNQNWDWGKRVNFDFGGYKVDKIILSATGNSFEVDNAAGAFQAVPEPATWAMMIIGFGAIGAVVRRRRTAFTLA